MGSNPSKEETNFWGLSGPVKSIVIVTAAVYAAKKITALARLLQLTTMLPNGRCHINFFSVKNLSPAMRPVFKVFDHLFYILSIIYWVLPCKSKRKWNEVPTIRSIQGM